MGKQKSRIAKPTPAELELVEKLNPRLAELGLRLVGPRTMRRLRPPDVVVDSKRQFDFTDLEPQESDFLIVTTRATSQAVIDNGFVCMDFTSEGVLESSVPFYQPESEVKRVPVFSEHCWRCSSTIGWIGDAVFSERDGGIDNAGVNTILRIDALAAPDLVRGILAGTITAVSVTDEFEFEVSHLDLDQGQFWEMQGHEVDGEIVRIIVTEYIRVFEESIVGMGADPDARILSARWAGERPSDSEDSAAGGQGRRRPKSGRRMVVVKTAAKEETGGTRGGGGAREQEEAMSTNSIDLDALAAILGREFADQDAVKTFMRELMKERAVLEESLTALKSEAAEHAPLVEAGKAYLETLRAAVQKAVDLIHVAREEKCSDELRKQIEEADLASLRQMVTLYEVKLAEAVKIPDEIGQRSSVPSLLNPPQADADAAKAEDSFSTEKGVFG